MATRRIKIEYDGSGPAYHAHVRDTHTGEVIDGVTRVQLDLNANDKGLPVAVMTIYQPVVNITVDADVRQICTTCGSEDVADKLDTADKLIAQLTLRNDELERKMKLLEHVNRLLEEENSLDISEIIKKSLENK